MDRFRTKLLNVWREVGQHIEIGEAAALIAPTLAADLPLHALLIRRIDVSRSLIETAAIGMVRDGQALSRTRNDLTSRELEELLAWCQAGRVSRGKPSKIAKEAPGALPDHAKGQALVGPLSNSEGPTGILVLLSDRTSSFDAPHEDMLRSLLQPFSVALENDARVRELTTLREAAEADRRSLLTRLGREEISDTIVGADSGLRHVMERVALVAGSDAPVLIFGETGSGKEVIARAIHARSRRATGPILRVNCGAIPQELIDSELFGHERGSFTGAVAMRKGWFERADGGTLFLDEIGELPLAAQVRLLRILQDGSFDRVGGQRQLNVNVRIVGATHRNLQAMVAEGRFREDLWYRLAVFPIHLPALREHPEDIPQLSMHFALKASRRFGTAPLTPTPEDVRLLVAYSWPGNIRELQSVMDRAVILGNGQKLEVAKALGATNSTSAPSIVPARTANEPQRFALPSVPDSFLTLDQAMARHIETALRGTRGRIEGSHGAAALLGINPHTLRARMRKLRVEWKQFRQKP